jgi:hyperosmotically inducible periplasmic protein
MANPVETLTKVVGFGVQQGTKILGGAISSITGGNDAAEQQQEPPQQRAARQRKSSQQPKPLDDVTITRKVESEIFRGSKVNKGKISVNTADGVVWLRGEAKNPEQIKELEAKAAAIPEVKRVENLLHLPKTPAPTRTDTPPSQRKTRATKSTQSARKVTSTRTTSEKRSTTAPKEPAPKDLAGTQAGRQPAPLGTDEGTGNGGSPSDS